MSACTSAQSVFAASIALAGPAPCLLSGVVVFAAPNGGKRAHAPVGCIIGHRIR